MMRITFVFALMGALCAVLAGCDDGEPQGGIAVRLDGETGQWVVDHPTSGLAWLRCMIGQSWNADAGRCDGEQTLFYLFDAVKACPAGFSLPTDADLASVICNYKGTGTVNCPLDEYDPCSECSVCVDLFGKDTDGWILSADMEKTESQGKDWWLTRVWDFKTGCATMDGDGGTDYLCYNVRCVKRPALDAGLLFD
jgi:hypothetical protein